MKQLKELKNKYIKLKETAEYVDIGQVVNDLYYLIQAEQVERNIRSGGMMPRI